MKLKNFGLFSSPSTSSSSNHSFSSSSASSSPSILFRIIIPCLLIFLSTLIQDAISSASTVTRRRHGEHNSSHRSLTRLGKDKRPMCYSEEPCKYVIAESSDSSNSIIKYSSFNTWCKCGEHQRCRIQSGYDKKRKTSIYTCQDKSSKRRSNNRKSSKKLTKIKLPKL